MKISKLLLFAGALALAGGAAAGLYGCAHTELITGNETVPGPGPGGKPMRTVTDAAVGMPAVAQTPIYPLTARVEVNDNYFGTRVADPYRWLEKLDSPAVQQWVAQENALSQPQLAALPQRFWLKKRLTQLWNYERYEAPVSRGGHYFYLHNDGAQNQSVLYVSEDLTAPGRVLFDPNGAREDATVSLADFTPSEQGTVMAYAVSDGGTDWEIWRFRRVKEGQDLPDTLRYTKFWGVSWAHDGSGVYYSRYPAAAAGKGDDAAKPAVYFHKLGTAQDEDRLVYEIKDHPTRLPTARVTEDGHYLVITQVDGYEKNGVEILDLRKPGATVQPLLMDWDALYNFIGSRGDELYFHTTHNAPLGRVIAVAANQGANRRTVVPEGTAAIEQASYVGGRIVASYVEDAHGVARIYERDGRLVGAVTLPGMGGIDGFQGRRHAQRDLLLLHRLPHAGAGVPPRRGHQPGDAVARAAGARLDDRLCHRAGVLQQQGRHARADVHHAPPRHGQGRQYAVAALRLRRLQHLGNAGLPSAGAGVAGDGRGLRRGEPARRRGVRRGLAQGRHARQQAARVR